MVILYPQGKISPATRKVILYAWWQYSYDCNQ
ncbi:hypothetical protein AAUPMC_01247, partial [Pasteurella multocida subsp. multocida str. Anand1_cattle]